MQTNQLTRQAYPQSILRVELTLNPEQALAVQQKLEQTSLSNISSTAIVQLGTEEGMALRNVLDDFLSRVDTESTAQLYELCQRIEEGVEKANLIEIRESILRTPKPSWWKRLFMMSKRAVEEAVRSAYDQTVADASARTTELNQFLDSLEHEMKDELNKLQMNVHELQDLKQSYRNLTEQFTVSVAVAQGLCEQARSHVATLTQQAQENPSSVIHPEIQEAESRLDLLESRTLALEGTVSRLPADWLVIQQIQNAGITTFQEVVTTASERFNNIKMTLLTLHGLLSVRGVQMIARKQQDLDSHLAKVRGNLMGEVVRTAAEAPGNNRLHQAQQLKQVIDDAIEMKQVVDTARESNRQKFSEARRIISDARNSLIGIADQTSTKLLPKESTANAIST